MSLTRRGGEYYGERRTQAVTPGGFQITSLDATRPEHEVETHTHEEAHFVFVMGGAYISAAAGAPVLSQSPLLVFNPSGVEHRDRFLHGRGRFLALTVGGEAALALAQAANEEDAVALRSLDPVLTARGLIHALATDGSTRLLEGLCWQLAAALSPEPLTVANDAPTWLGRAFEMIWTSEEPDLRISQVAAEAGVHPVHLARGFRRHLGCAPGEHLRGRRLERAAALLGRGRAGLAAVSADVGFTDQSHMTRAFRGAFGMTPARWRREAQVSRIQERGAA